MGGMNLPRTRKWAEETCGGDGEATSRGRDGGIISVVSSDVRDAPSHENAKQGVWGRGGEGFSERKIEEGVVCTGGGVAGVSEARGAWWWREPSSAATFPRPGQARPAR